MDTTTNKGMEPSDLALKISQAVLNGDENLVISPFYMKATILLQHLFPTLISSIMKKKAIKAKSLEKSSSLFVCWFYFKNVWSDSTNSRFAASMILK